MQGKRHFTGIYLLRAAVEGNFRVTTAAVNKLYERATAAAIRKTIASYSVKLGIFE